MILKTKSFKLMFNENLQEQGLLETALIKGYVG